MQEVQQAVILAIAKYSTCDYSHQKEGPRRRRKTKKKILYEQYSYAPEIMKCGASNMNKLCSKLVINQLYIYNRIYMKMNIGTNKRNIAIKNGTKRK